MDFLKGGTLGRDAAEIAWGEGYWEGTIQVDGEVRWGGVGCCGNSVGRRLLGGTTES